MAGDEAGRFADVEPALLIPAVNNLNPFALQSQQLPRQLGLRPPAGFLIALASDANEFHVGVVSGAGSLAVGLGLGIHLGRQTTQAVLADIKAEATEPAVASGDDEQALLAIDFYLVVFLAVHDSIVTGELKLCPADDGEFWGTQRAIGNVGESHSGAEIFSNPPVILGAWD